MQKVTLLLNKPAYTGSWLFPHSYCAGFSILVLLFWYIGVLLHGCYRLKSSALRLYGTIASENLSIIHARAAHDACFTIVTSNIYLFLNLCIKSVIVIFFNVISIPQYISPSSGQSLDKRDKSGKVWYKPALSNKD